MTCGYLEGRRGRGENRNVKWKQNEAGCLFGPGTQQIKSLRLGCNWPGVVWEFGSLLVEAAKQNQKNKTGDAAVDLDTARKRNLKTTQWSPNQRKQNNTEEGRWGGSEGSGPTGFGESGQRWGLGTTDGWYSVYSSHPTVGLVGWRVEGYTVVSWSSGGFGLPGLPHCPKIPEGWVLSWAATLP